MKYTKILSSVLLAALGLAWYAEALSPSQPPYIVTGVTQTTAQIMQYTTLGFAAKPAEAKGKQVKQVTDICLTAGLTAAHSQETNGTLDSPTASGAVGITQFLLAGQRIRTFVKTAPLFADVILDTTADFFFGTVNQGYQSEIAQVLYDSVNSQWLIVGNTVGTSAQTSLLLFAVGQDPIASASTWTFFAVDTPANYAANTTSTPAFTQLPNFSPNGMGQDTNNVYIATTINGFNDLEFFDQAIYWFTKPTSASPNSITVSAFRGLETQIATPLVGIQPAQNFDLGGPNDGTGIFVGVSLADAAAGASSGAIWPLTLNTTSNMLTESATPISVFPFIFPINISIPGTNPITPNVPSFTPGVTAPRQIAFEATNFFNPGYVHIQFNTITGTDNLYLVQQTGVPTPGPAVQNGVNWYQIDLSSFIVLNSGTLSLVGFSNTGLFTPSIMSDSFGNVIVGATQGGVGLIANPWPNAIFIQVMSGFNTPIATPSFNALTLSSNGYNPTEDFRLAPFLEWAQYTTTTRDTSSTASGPSNFWTVLPYSWEQAANQWAINVSSLNPCDDKSSKLVKPVKHS